MASLVDVAAAVFDRKANQTVKSPSNLALGNICLLPPQSPKKKGLMTVVLDMDETMIHSNFVGCSREENRQQELLDGRPHSDFFLEVCDGVAVYIRPGLAHFLKLLDQLFEVVVFTAGEKDYADAVLDYVDPEGYIAHRLYRESTCEFRGLNYVKDLNHLGRNMTKCVLLDNNLVSLAATPDNCILIDDFFTDKTDRELPLVASILMDLSELEDVRPILRDAFSIRETVDHRFFAHLTHPLRDFREQDFYDSCTDDDHEEVNVDQFCDPLNSDDSNSEQISKSSTTSSIFWSSSSQDSEIDSEIERLTLQDNASS